MVALAAPETAPFYPAQADFIGDDRRFVAFIGGRNSGKTYSGAVKAWRCVADRPRSLGLIAAPDFPMLEFGAKRAFLDRLRTQRIPFTLQQQRGVVSIPLLDAEVRFATLETESRVRGPNYDWAWVDEVEYVSDRAIWQALKGAVRGGPNPQLFVTSTPKGRRLVYDEWVVRATLQHALYKASTRDNIYIDAEDYIAGLGYSGVFAQQEINAEFVAFEGLVYPAFSREQHIAQVDTEGWGTILALDVGTRNPTALLTIRHAGDRLHVAAEHYERGMSSDDITDAAVAAYERWQPEYLVVDPSAAGLIVSLQRRNLNVRKAVNDVLIGISRVTGTLADLTVDQSCVNLIAEFESYRYPDGRRGATDAPVKEHDHALDALRYAVMELAAHDLTGRLFV